jgi:hypothetical protein
MVLEFVSRQESQKLKLNNIFVDKQERPKELINAFSPENLDHEDFIE